MDYEKKYNEALERVRRLHDRMQVLSSTDALVASSELEFIFPELAESEDERIRKGIIEIIKAVSGPDCDVYLNEKKQEKYLAWLEKQKEKSEIPIMDGDTDTYFDDLRMTTKPLTSREWFDEGIKYAQRLQKEQKPAWSEEDEHRRTDAIYFLESAKSHYADTSEIEKTILWLKSLRPSWKPSEEQMKALEAATVRYQSTGLESLYEELKKL